MNMLPTNTIDRQNDKAQDMAGQAPEGAKRYVAIYVNGDVVGAQELEPGPIWGVTVQFDETYLIVLEDESEEQARVHAAEIMQSYLED